jgi:ABC-type polysaccharide/polyol phosphate export permease
LFLALAGLLGLGIGAIIRNTAGAISLFFGVMFALDPIVDLLPTTWRNDLINYLPVNAGTQIFTTVNVKGSLAPWNGLAVFVLYPAVALLAGFLLIDVRDA